MKRSLAVTLAGVAVAGAIVAAVGLTRTPDAGRRGDAGSAQPPAATPSGLDPLVEEFRATERTCIRTFNEALRAQREGSIDELELSNTIERDVLVPWRALRTRIDAAPPHDELYTTLRRYVEARQISWEAYVTALRAPDDAAAAPHYATHREQNALAQAHAQHLGDMFRAAASRR